MEEDEEAVYLCELEHNNITKEFYISNENDGEIYSVDEDDDIGEG